MADTPQTLAGATYAITPSSSTRLIWSHYATDNGGVYAITGATVGLVPSIVGGSNHPLTLAGATYTITGASTRLIWSVYYNAGSYFINGSALTLTPSGPTGSQSITIGGGTYAVTGSSVTLDAVKNNTPGVYLITGSAVTLTKNTGAGQHPSLVLNGGVYAINPNIFQPMVFKSDRHPNLVGGVYTITGGAVNLIHNGTVGPQHPSLSLGASTYAITGAALTFTPAHRGIIGSGTYFILGANADLNLVINVGTYVVPLYMTRARARNRVTIASRRERSE